jgi:predicted nuclease of restriction endonuclease-like RecB superfamily
MVQSLVSCENYSFRKIIKRYSIALLQGVMYYSKPQALRKAGY